MIDIDDRYEQRRLFRDTFQLNDEGYSRLAKLWMIFGNNGIKHTNAGHYFIQEIIEHNFVDWKCWHKKLHKDLVEIIKTEYPQLMVTCEDYTKKL